MEIMIVIFLIGIIGGAISYNMRGSLDRGRAFKTEQVINQLSDIIELELSNGHYTAEQIASNQETQLNIIKASGFSKDAKKMLKDGWNAPLKFATTGRTNDRIKITSDKLVAYNNKQRKLLSIPQEQTDEDAEDTQ